MATDLATGMPMEPAARLPMERTARVGTSRLARFRQEVRTALMVWNREVIRFRRNPARIVTSFVQPVLYLFVLGYGLGNFVNAQGGPSYRQYLFPGSVAMNVISTALFSGVSIVWDREFGFLREMLVAPVSRASIILGKALGGAVTATAQGCVMLALAPVIGVRLTWASGLGFAAGAFLMAFALTAFGVFVASRMKKMEGFQVVMQFLLFPMIFLSGVMFPVRGLPPWLEVLTRVNPLTYAVDPLRRILLGAKATAAQGLASGVTLFGHVLPVWGELAIMAGFATVFLGAAIATFGRAE